ncbi:MAG: hypothetical protein IJA44_05155, partial [Clostridia bacterium]|nr:hypothetical protein [Clostridia bacterium]
MVKTICKKVLPMFLALVLVMSVLPLGFMASAATTVNVLDGQLSITDSANSNTVSGDTVTIKASGSLFGKKTNNITITNETAEQKKLSFSYSVESASSFKIAGATAATSGNYSVILDAGASLAITLVSNSGLSNRTATLTLSGFALDTIASESNVTFQFDNTLGSITVNGVSAANGSQEKISLETGATLVATANSNVKFLGWVNAANNEILSTAVTYAYNPTSDATVIAAFAQNGGKPWFSVGGTTQKTASSGLLGMSKIYYYTVATTYLFDDLNEAATAAAANASAKALVLMNNATLPAGDYTIPTGVSLLIPFNDANTMYTTQVENISDGDPGTGTGIDKNTNYITPTAYRTLTMADGAKLIINGSVSVSAKQHCAQGSKPYGGAPSGPAAFVNMQGDSQIIVNGGGVLYAYGFITGSGSVVAYDQSQVYEMFQITDFRGGTQSTDMDNRVFPLSQYYVQNIEVPLTLHYGAKEYSYTTIYMSSADFGTAVGFIGPSGAMFNLTSGSVTKRYDGSKDRLRIELNGTMTVSPIEMKVGTSSINSKDYRLPVNSNISITVNGGSEIVMSQDVVFLPGSEIFLKESAKCTVGEGVNVYVYDVDQWGGYAAPSNQKFIPAVYAPGRTYNRTEADLKDALIQVDGYIDASKGYVYTTAGGANIYSTGTGVVDTKKGETKVIHELVQGTGYVEIPITPVKIKNANGDFVQTATDTYTYTNGKWICTGHNIVIDAAVDATCTTTGLTEGKHCSVCGTVIVAQQEVPALGHSYTSTTTDATCTEAGKTVYTCTGCGHSYEEAIEATGHNYTSTTTDATCTENGKIVYTCTACGDSYEEVIDAKGHTEVIDAAVDATCTTTGLTEGKHCSVCGTVIVAQQEVPALGHSYDNACDADCNLCGDVREVSCDHVYGDWVVDVAATTNKAGSKHRECSECGAKETEVIPMVFGFRGASLELQSSLGIIYTINADLVKVYGYTNIYATFEINGVTTTVTEY